MLFFVIISFLGYLKKLKECKNRTDKKNEVQNYKQNKKVFKTITTKKHLKS